jgi:FtsZ-binding cell division protein ZapB
MIENNLKMSKNQVKITRNVRNNLKMSKNQVKVSENGWQ